jgi:non-homologous end joining protein Ku
VDRDEVDPIYLDTPYYIYPDGELTAQTFRVIGEAVAHKNKGRAWTRHDLEPGAAGSR